MTVPTVIIIICIVLGIIGFGFCIGGILAAGKNYAQYLNKVGAVFMGASGITYIYFLLWQMI